jgi:3',5'-cyclic AMP phosphodiesterase CpdA
MRTIVHLSDLHFGSVAEETLAPLVRQIWALEPQLVVISGDLTQRARIRQFEEARRFLEALPKPQIVVPGNHDVPAYNLYKRFVNPLKYYLRLVTDDLLPTYFDDEMAVLGLNSTRSFTTKHGKLREKDLEQMRDRLMGLAGNAARIVVCHHPFDLPGNHTPRDLIRNAAAAMRTFAECRVDLVLSGHLHLGYTCESTRRYRIPGHSALLVQAGTATSNRYRGEENAFNVLRLQTEKLVVERYAWDAKRSVYVMSKTEAFTRTPDGWS